MAEGVCIGWGWVVGTPTRDKGATKMSNLLPTNILHDVERVLLDRVRNSDDPPFLTAYQILDRLPDQIRSRLIAERGMGGARAGVNYAAPSVVSDAAEMLQGIDIRWLDTRTITVDVNKQPITPGAEVVAVYRLLR